MTLDEHEAQKARWERYREAARRLYPQAKFSPLCHVGEPAERDGAFIEIAVWIPRAELVCGAVNRHVAPQALKCSLEYGHEDRTPHYDLAHHLYFLDEK